VIAPATEPSAREPGSHCSEIARVELAGMVNGTERPPTENITAGSTAPIRSRSSASAFAERQRIGLRERESDGRLSQSSAAGGSVESVVGNAAGALAVPSG